MTNPTPLRTDLAYRDCPVCVPGGFASVKLRFSDSRYVGFSCKGHPLANKSRFVPEHLVIVFHAMGHRELPDGAQVHHVDGNKANNEPSNLVVCENQKYHHLLHIRQKVLARGGNPDTDKICYCCQKVLNQSEFTRNSNKFDGLRCGCKKCNSGPNIIQKRRRRAELRSQSVAAQLLAQHAEMRAAKK